MLKHKSGTDDWKDVLNAGDSTNIGGYRYQIHHLSITYPDGSHGSAVLFRQEESLPIYWKVLVPLIVLLALVATSIFLTYLVSRSIIRPLYSLKHAAEQISEGRLDGEVKSTTKDEIGELAEAFETMRVRLKASIEERLQDEDNRKMLLSHISHDLKTPITAIKGYVEGILDGVANTQEKQEKYLRTVYRKATDMDRLIDELFLFSRLDMHHVAYDFKPIDLRRYLAHYTEELQFELEKESIALVSSGIEGPPLIVVADPEKLGRVFHNIIGNSIKYMNTEDGAANRFLAIQVSENEEEITVELRDNGPGVSPESLPMLFDHFYRTEQSRNVETGGSGLGLAIVKQIMEGHGGAVRAELPPDGGLAIIVTLHRWPEHDKQETAGGEKQQ
nr:HAMP domain-containing sensor histidine kinase [Paenibacillus sp. MMS18-CY102]